MMLIILTLLDSFEGENLVKSNPSQLNLLIRNNLTCYVDTLQAVFMQYLCVPACVVITTYMRGHFNTHSPPYYPTCT